MILIPGKLYMNVYYGDLIAYAIDNKVLRIPTKTILLYLKTSSALSPFVECFFIHGTMQISFIFRPKNTSTYLGQIYD